MVAALFLAPPAQPVAVRVADLARREAVPTLGGFIEENVKKRRVLIVVYRCAAENKKEKVER